ncbi:hypothetical protein [Methyloceanibacter caenitepidi]|uniref:hypothetical protein n=1 Tax=Methyloceanibacter caenitepidi TaxID=1384459 RepID=UPI001ABA8E1C|nr:hypothetical protein [Methyloceanibacter caenitepidi]
MRWLRKERDLIGLIMIWGLLLQSLVIPMSSTAHAAMLASGSDTAGIICTTRTASPVPAGTFAPGEQKQSQNSADCQCCHMSCRQGCGGMCGGTGLGAFAYLVTPHRAFLSAAEKANTPAAYDAGLFAESQPRAPPLA